MIEQTRKVYRCEKCKKCLLQKSAMLKHEQYCGYDNKCLNCKLYSSQYQFCNVKNVFLRTKAQDVYNDAKYIEEPIGGVVVSVDTVVMPNQCNEFIDN